MNTAWAREEKKLWDAMMDPVPEKRRWLAQASRKLRRLENGPKKAALHKEVDRTRVEMFTSGWHSYHSWVKH
jgi:hypothetical protein